MRMYVIILIGLVFSLLMGKAYAQQIGIKTNALYWAATTPNVGVEVRIGKKWTAELNGMYNPWKFKENKKMAGFLIQPEVKWWLCQAFYQHAVGLELHYGQYNGGFSKYRYQGDIKGGGFSYSYSWILNRRWNLEVSAAVGYAHLSYDKYDRPTCGFFLEKGQTNYVGLTKLGVNFIYFIK